MNDERIEKRLSIVKRNLHFLWLFLSPLSIGFKFLLEDDLSSLTIILPELVLFFGSLFSLCTGLVINWTTDVIDERIVRKKYLLYQRSFWVLIVCAGIAYLVQIVESDVMGLSYALPANSFVNTAITLSFLVYYISARKQNIYLNFKFIENDRSSYYKQVGKTILKMGAVAVIYGLLGVLIQYLFQGTQYILTMMFVCFVSFLITAFEYFLLSILEKNHYDEALSHEHGKTILLSKNVRILMIIEIVLSFFLNVISSIASYLYTNDIELPLQWIPFFRAVKSFAPFYQIPLVFLGFFAALLAFHSLKRSLPRYVRMLKLLFILYVIETVVSFLELLFFSIFRFLPILNDPEVIITVASVATIFGYLPLIIWFLSFFLFLDRRYSFAWLILAKTVLLVINYLALRVLFQGYPLGILYYVVTNGLGLVQSVLSIILLYRMTAVYVMSEPVTENEITVENKALE